MNLLPTEHRLSDLERRVAALEKPQRVDDGLDEPTEAAIRLIKKIRRIAQQGGCTMSPAAWALIQRSVPADLTHAVQPFPEAD